MTRQRIFLSPINLYIALLAGFSALLLFLSLLGLATGRVAGKDPWWTAGSTFLIAFATARPVELRSHLKMSLRAAFQLMAAVLLGPPHAMLAAGVGVSLGYFYHLYQGGYGPEDLFFSTAEGVVSTGIGGFVYQLVTAIGLGPAGEPLALLAAAESMHLCNALLIAGAISLSGQDTGIGKTFLQIIRKDPLQYVALLVSGMLAAHLAIEHAFWAVPLLLVPLAVVERTLVKQREEAERERKLAVMEEVDALKNDFIAAVTHDLRTPLMVIKGFGELLAEREDELKDDERRAVECINLNTERLSELIETLLQLSELDAGMVILQRAPADVPAIIRRVLDQMSYHAEQKGVALDMTVSGHVPAFELDRARMEQVVSNLLGNAIKFTPRGGQVCVDLAFRDEQLVLTVSDNGPGIPPEVLPRVFDRFYRAHHVEGDRRQTGGLGLAIAKSIVELHGGTITAASTVGEGSIFTVLLPQTKPTEGQQEGPNARDRALAEILHPARPLPNAR
jgi:signal transduction histidine kinase